MLQQLTILQRDHRSPSEGVDSLENPQGVTIHLKTSKTGPFRLGVNVHLACTVDDLCPVASLLA